MLVGDSLLGREAMPSPTGMVIGLRETGDSGGFSCVGASFSVLIVGADGVGMTDVNAEKSETVCVLRIIVGAPYLKCPGYPVRLMFCVDQALGCYRFESL